MERVRTIKSDKQTATDIQLDRHIHSLRKASIGGYKERKD